MIVLFLCGCRCWGLTEIPSVSTAGLCFPHRDEQSWHCFSRDSKHIGLECVCLLCTTPRHLWKCCPWGIKDFLHSPPISSLSSLPLNHGDKMFPQLFCSARCCFILRAAWLRDVLTALAQTQPLPALVCQRMPEALISSMALAGDSSDHLRTKAASPAASVPAERNRESQAKQYKPNPVLKGLLFSAKLQPWSAMPGVLRFLLCMHTEKCLVRREQSPDHRVCNLEAIWHWGVSRQSQLVTSAFPRGLRAGMENTTSQ